MPKIETIISSWSPHCCDSLSSQSQKYHYPFSLFSYKCSQLQTFLLSYFQQSICYYLLPIFPEKRLRALPSPLHLSARLYLSFPKVRYTRHWCKQGDWRWYMDVPLKNSHMCILMCTGENITIKNCSFFSKINAFKDKKGGDLKKIVNSNASGMWIPETVKTVWECLKFGNTAWFMAHHLRRRCSNRLPLVSLPTSSRPLDYPPQSCQIHFPRKQSQ